MKIGDLVICKGCELTVYECVYERKDLEELHCTDFKGVGDIPSPGIYTKVECPKCNTPLEIN